MLRDGIPRRLEARGQAFLDDSGRAVRFIGTVLNITGRKRAEEELRASHRTIADILGQMTDGCSGLDQDLRDTYVNRRWESIFGKESGDVIGKPFGEVLPSLDGTVAVLTIALTGYGMDKDNRRSFTKLEAMIRRVAN